ncbi:MAG TPA: phosphoglycerate kinase [Gammaproteobacteria bacterium]|nr:phosphoglycerate kinase [Gammaproteobacteria bacterium]
MSILRMSEVSLKGKRVVIREDFNVPIKNGEITSDLRLRAALPTIKKAMKEGAEVLLLSHLGRPEEGVFDEQYSLAPIAKRLSELLKLDVPLLNWQNGALPHQSLALLENVRFMPGEKENEKNLAKKIAGLGDIYIMDAFATAHRAEASTCGAIQYASLACAGPLLTDEIDALNKIMLNPKHPILAIVGGSKVSTKLSLLETLINKVDFLLVGGGIANTFLGAQGYSVGKSLYEADLLDEAERLILAAEKRGTQIPLPVDVIVAEKMSEDSETAVRLISHVDDSEKILDIGPDTIKQWVGLIKKAKTIIWNGPVGAFEFDAFSEGTKAISKAIGASKAFVVAGGGDTLAAIEKYRIATKVDYISTGGGAFLAFLEGKSLPAIQALEQRQSRTGSL